MVAHRTIIVDMNKGKPILCYAMPSEVKPILDRVETLFEESYGQAKLYDCRYEGKSFYILAAGIGKVAAGASLAATLCQKDVTHVFNIGVGGSIDATRAPSRTAVIGSRYAQHDVDTSAIGDPVGLISGIYLTYLPSDEEGQKKLIKACEKFGVPYNVGTIASGDLFVSKAEERKRIKTLFDAVSCDMETAAFAQVAYTYGKPFNGLRMISDAESAGEYEKNIPYCTEMATDIALEMLLS